MKLDVIAEEKDYIVVNKPAGLIVHGDGKKVEETLVDLVLVQYPEIKGVGEQWQNNEGVVIDRSGIVHRLDRDTSGVILVARTQKGFEYLKELFRSRKINKEYVAIVYGVMPQEKGVIDAMIGKSRSNFRMWSASRGARGVMRSATTEYEQISTFEEKGVTYSVVRFYPKTGRTHQIRVHAKYLHHPIVGDGLYAGKLWGNNPGVLGLGRQALHAQMVEFVNLEGEAVSYRAELPFDLGSAIPEKVIAIL